jgi:SH3-like domain-containing protein
MTRLHSFRPALLLLLGLALPIPAPAQTQPAQGFLHAPSRNAPARRTAAPPPPKASPVAPVQQVAPFSSPVVHPPASALGRSAPGHAAPKRAARPASTHHTAPRASRHHKATRPPVVQAPKPAQARKPQGAAATPTPAAPAAVAAAALAAARPPVPEPSPDRPAVDHSKGTVTGLPLPRWVALRSADVNMRTGPGTRYPVEWQYHRRDLPVKLEREFGVWRLLEDQDGVKGWVHEANLTSRRGFVLVGPQQTLRRDPSDSAGAVALLKPGVVGRIVACKAHAAWCQVRAGGYGGWLKRTAIWGIFPGEAVSN